MKRTEPAPVLLFVFNRPAHTLATLKALAANHLANESELYIFSDGPRNESDIDKVQQVRTILPHYQDSFKALRIHESLVNKGLANSIVEGVSLVISQHGKVIVIEDDIVTSSYFLTYMNEALEAFENRKDIFSISGYLPPIDVPSQMKEKAFLWNRISSWGWATWNDRWEKTDWEMSGFNQFIQNKSARRAFESGGEDVSIMLLKQYTGKIDSWAIRFNYTCYLNNAFCVYPGQSLVHNIGHDGSGTHSGRSHKYATNFLPENYVDIRKKPPPFDKELAAQMRSVFSKSLIRKTINFCLLKKYLFTIWYKSKISGKPA